MRTGRRWTLVLLMTAAATLLVFGYDWLFTVTWVSKADLEIEFAVTEEAIGQPVNRGKISIRSEGGFYEDREPKMFTLDTNADGEAQQTCKDSMSYGTTSALRIRSNSYVVRLPFWYYQVSAPGY